MVRQRSGNLVKIEVYVDRELKEDFQKACFQNYRTMSDVIRRSILSFLRKHPIKDQPYISDEA